ncbi:hypothetical protein [Rugamonas aquatica]|uniref:Uncharacterized protein n=1 Tax=Rugamonas aquatica TaxID=2743357 RepID=A0A6A7N5M4_9BURK|nr:hypothetical protein [Rugamonas aquatica]MQA40162.1 hypothetical protein [Rugamonas aquatica]
MARRGVIFLLLSVIGGGAGAFVASLISFWLYPQLQSDLPMFLRDLFSFGAAASAVFVWLFYVPAFIVLLLLNKRFMAANLKDWPYGVFLGVSFLLVFISQIHPFAVFSSGVLEYLLNTILAGMILTGTVAILRSRRNE